MRSLIYYLCPDDSITKIHGSSGQRPKTMKDINIYLTTKQKQKLIRLTHTYKLSMSTIADIIGYWTLQVWGKYGLENQPDILNNYLESGKKTHIKPKRLGNDPLALSTKAHLISNAIVIYLNDEIEQYIKPKGVKIYQENIIKELKETKETWYSYNAFVRKQARFVRENPEYVRKLLGEN